jgi:exopolysaccharide production protein ExoZ
MPSAQLTPQATPKSTPTTIQSVQVLRAIAAIMVVALHACNQAAPFGAQAFPLGNAGVDIFFPISGFVMVVSTHDRQASAATAGRFALARILRIAPIYWLLTLVKAAAVMVRPGLFSGAAVTAGSLAAALLFVPLHDAGGVLANPPIKPGWTLNLEMFYYALIVLVLPFSRRIALYVPLLIAALVIAAGLLFPHFPAFSREMGWGSPLALEFAAGMLLGEFTLTRTGAGRWPWLAVILGLAIYAFVPRSIDQAEWGRVVSWGAAGGCFLWAAIGLERWVANRAWARFPMLLGDASYSIYLTHALSQPLITVVAGKAIFQTLGAPGLVGILVILPTLAGVVFHLLIEKPMTKGLKRLLPRRASGTATRAERLA